MAVQTIVLYAPRLYGVSTYSTNQDPESLSASLSDSVAMSDADTQAAIKALSEAIAMAETWITSGTKSLSDTATMSETLAKALVKATMTESLSMTDARVIAAVKALSDLMMLSDSLVTTGIKALTESATLTEGFLVSFLVEMSDDLLIDDAAVRIQQIKGLSDFILLNDWLELKLNKADVWDSHAAFGTRPSQIHLYGPGVYYGVDYYGSNPTVIWLPITANSTIWQTTEQSSQGETLYAEASYGQRAFGSVPAVGWTAPVSTARQAWVNFNGESHN
jgi:hypothetical protein